MVIFGATGDLTKRKLLPALYNLAKEDFLPHKFAIIGVGRQEMSSEDFRKMVLEELKEFVTEADDKLIKWFQERTFYTGGDFDDDKKLFGDLKQMIGDVTRQLDTGQLLFLSRDAADPFRQCGTEGREERPREGGERQLAPLHL